MIEIYIMAASVFLLAILLTFLPLGLTRKGKAIVWVSGVGTSFLLYISISTVSILGHFSYYYNYGDFIELYITQKCGNF